MVAALPMRMPTSQPATIAVSSSRPSTARSLPCAHANVAGTASEFGCRIDSLWMSSISKPWPAVLFTSAACATETFRPVPHMDAFGAVPSATATRCTMLVQGRCAP